MSLLNTKPRYFPSSIATNRGWTNPITGEVLVSIGNLKSKLEAEFLTITEQPKEVIMETNTETQVKVKREYNKKPKVIGEVVEQPVETNKQIIGEVVEYDLDK